MIHYGMTKTAQLAVAIDGTEASIVEGGGATDAPRGDGSSSTTAYSDTPSQGFSPLMVIIGVGVHPLVPDASNVSAAAGHRAQSPASAGAVGAELCVGGLSSALEHAEQVTTVTRIATIRTPMSALLLKWRVENLRGTGINY
jgi:hypothetical protein